MWCRLYKDNRHQRYSSSVSVALGRPTQKCSPYIVCGTAYCNPRMLEFAKSTVRLPNSTAAPPLPILVCHRRCAQRHLHRHLGYPGSTLRPTPLLELRSHHSPPVGPPPRVTRRHLHRRLCRPRLPPSIARPSLTLVLIATPDPGAAPNRCCPPMPVAAPDPDASLTRLFC
jgi:hypothetical protein